MKISFHGGDLSEEHLLYALNEIDMLYIILPSNLSIRTSTMYDGQHLRQRQKSSENKWFQTNGLIPGFLFCTSHSAPYTLSYIHSKNQRRQT